MALVLQLQAQSSGTPSDSCPAGGCVDSEPRSTIATGGGPNDLFDDYDSIYSGLWTADPDAGQELFPLGPLAQPSLDKTRLQAEHTALWEAARKKEMNPTPEEKVGSTHLTLRG